MGGARSGSVCRVLTKRAVVHIALLLTAVSLASLVKVSHCIVVLA